MCRLRHQCSASSNVPRRTATERGTRRDGGNGEGTAARSAPSLGGVTARSVRIWERMILSIEGENTCARHDIVFVVGVSLQLCIRDVVHCVFASASLCICSCASVLPPCVFCVCSCTSSAQCASAPHSRLPVSRLCHVLTCLFVCTVSALRCALVAAHLCFN